MAKFSLGISPLSRRVLHGGFLMLLAAVFTIGLSFATVELPYLIDDALQSTITAPNLDSHADELSVLKTELFISHFKLRLIGYVCFALMVLAIVAGVATRRTGLAVLGAVGFMLPVFAQFAAVMFFLAGLGVLNILWLPVLDISYELQRLGLIIRAPYDMLSWPFCQVGVSGYWPIVYFFIGSGLLLFFFGTFAWLSARARKQQVADFWVYRISRHPQYLGWILWSYGIYLLLLQQRYPKRSWGIEASLPWLLSTLVIIGVAMLEELNMRRRHGEAYEAYRRSAPLLFPVPAFVARLFALPFRLLFKKSQADSKREVAAVLSLYAVVLMAASALVYGGGWKSTTALIMPSANVAEMEEIAARLVAGPNRRSHGRCGDCERLAAFGEPAVDYFLPLLESEQVEVRILAAEYLGKIPAERSVPALLTALDDSVANVRVNALGALAASGLRGCVEPMLRLLDDRDASVRTRAMRSLAQLGAEEIIERADEGLRDPDARVRQSTVESLGVLGSEKALPLVTEGLNDEKAWVRRTAVAALLKIGSPAARGALLRASRDEDWEVRMYAAEALKRLDDSDL
ncbi:MAG: HEAT repeat domain-containing protein [Gemmatimonadota bacterium]|nr:MAG: HEAT repeat domain-containing protein [Gemmatimonadota bacterium]